MKIDDIFYGIWDVKDIFVQNCRRQDIDITLLTVNFCD